jgi:hypothetical protein
MPSTAILTNFEDDSITGTVVEDVRWSLKMPPAAALRPEELAALEALCLRAGDERGGNVFFEPRAVLASSALTKHTVHWLMWSLGDQLCFAAPVIKLKFANISVLKVWTHTYAPLGTPLMTHKFEFAPLIDALSKQGYSALVCPWLETDSVLARAAENQTRHEPGFWSCKSERVVLTSDWVREKALSSQRKKKLRKMQRKVALDHRVLRGAVARDEGFREFCNLEAMGWKGKAGSALKQRDISLKFAQELVAGHAARNTLTIDSLEDPTRSGDRSVAMVIGFEQAGRGVVWKIGHHTDYEAVSPGYQLMLAASERFAMQSSDLEIDSLAGPDHPLVGRLWPGRKTVGTLVIPLAGSSLKARLISWLHEAEHRLRQKARSVRQRLRG